MAKLTEYVLLMAAIDLFVLGVYWLTLRQRGLKTSPPSDGFYIRYPAALAMAGFFPLAEREPLPVALMFCVANGVVGYLAVLFFVITDPKMMRQTQAKIEVSQYRSTFSVRGTEGREEEGGQEAVATWGRWRW